MSQSLDLSHIILILVIALLLIDIPSAASCPQACECSKLVVNCKKKKLSKIPEDIPPSATILYLGYNQITTIPAGAFENLKNLTELSLKHNKLFTELVNVDAFRGLKKLKHLYLTANSLTGLQRNHFKDLISLQRLYLTQNSIKAIPDLYYCKSLIRFVIDNNKLQRAQFPDGFRQLKNLTSIILSNNGITTLEYSDVQSLNNSDIQNINMARCNLQQINASIFSMFPHLQSLTLSYNALNITVVQDIVNHLQSSNITSLRLRNITSESLPSEMFANFSSVPLRNLDLADSKINLLKNGTFTSLKHLVSLDLSRSNIVYIMDNTFGEIGVNLVLKLGYNRLGTVPMRLPSSLQELDLYHNGIGILDNNQFMNLVNLRKLDLSNCRIHQMKDAAFTGLANLQILDLSHNQIGGSNIGNKLFQPLLNLRNLNLKGNSMRTIPTQVKMFESLDVLTSLDMSDNGCTDLVKGIFKPLKSLQLLDLSGNNLGSYIENQAEWAFLNLSSLKQLLLKDSGLYYLPMQLFHELTSLMLLDLSHNKISGWESGIFKETQNLNLVNLSSNGIAVINETSIKYLPEGVVLDLTGNPFSCWCDLMWFRHWIDILKNTSHASLPGNASYVCHSPKSMLGKSVLNFVPSSIVSECFPPPWKKILITAVIVPVALITGIASVMYRYRWSIRLKWYLMKKSWKRRRSDERQLLTEDEPFDYDVCVLYGPKKEDCNWVKQELIPLIDTNRDGEWNVFFEERDALPNKPDFEQIAEAIYHSKKFILIITSGYLNDSRKQSEIDLVFSSIAERKVKSQDVIILIELEEGARVKVPHLLRPLCTGDCCMTKPEGSDGQELFMRQLKEKLSEEVHRDSHVEV